MSICTNIATVPCFDGFSTVAEYAEYSKEVNQKYLCITDHGTMAVIPGQIAEADKHNLTPIFGCEMYINKMQPKVNSRDESAEFRKGLSEAEQKVFDKSNHLLGIAYNNEGYRNLVRLTSWGWIHGYYRKPRINHEILQQHKAGIIFTSTCANSEIANAFFEGGDEAGFAVVKQYLDWFGENFYLELMMLDFKLQAPYDAFLIRAHDKYNIPFILTQDCHYCKKEHSQNQRLMLMINTKRTIHEVKALIESGQADDLFELQDENLWMKSEDELNAKWESDYQEVIDYEIYKQAKANTVKVCEKARGVSLDRTIKLPQFEDDKAKLLEHIKKGIVIRAIPTNGAKGAKYINRIKEEYELICNKGFASYFLIQKMMVDEAFRVCRELYGFSDASMARGPGRGSIGGSLVGYLLDLHDVDPVENDLYFSRFLSKARGGKQMKTRFTQEPILIGS